MVSKRLITLEDVTVKKITERAMLVVVPRENGKPEEMWLPKSQIDETDCLADGDEGYIVITEWIAKQKGLLDEEDD